MYPAEVIETVARLRRRDPGNGDGNRALKAVAYAVVLIRPKTTNPFTSASFSVSRQSVWPLVVRCWTGPGTPPVLVSRVGSSLTIARNAGEDLVGDFVPDKRLGSVIADRQVLTNRRLERPRAAMRAAFDLLLQPTPFAD